MDGWDGDADPRLDPLEASAGARCRYVRARAPCRRTPRDQLELRRLARVRRRTRTVSSRRRAERQPRVDTRRGLARRVGGYRSRGPRGVGRARRERHTGRHRRRRGGVRRPGRHPPGGVRTRVPVVSDGVDRRGTPRRERRDDAFRQDGQTRVRDAHPRSRRRRRGFHLHAVRARRDVRARVRRIVVASGDSTRRSTQSARVSSLARLGFEGDGGGTASSVVGETATLLSSRSFSASSEARRGTRGGGEARSAVGSVAGGGRATPRVRRTTTTTTPTRARTVEGDVPNRVMCVAPLRRVVARRRSLLRIARVSRGARNC